MFWYKVYWTITETLTQSKVNTLKNLSTAASTEQTIHDVFDISSFQHLEIPRCKKPDHTSFKHTTTSYNEFLLKTKIRRFFFKLLLDTRAKRLTQHVIDSTTGCTSLLDLGCGDMILTEHIHLRSDLKVTGIDTVNSNLSHLPLTLYNGDTIPFSDKTFDATMVAYVLHHCNDIPSVLQEMKRVTSKKMIIFEEVYRNDTSRRVLKLHDFGNRLLSSKMNIPCNFMRIEEWNDLFVRHGLKVEKCTRIHQYPMLNLTHQVLFELAV